ncbi:type I-E CRISPR-associated protein Cse2/CasB [Streptomyces sp. NPDC008125]|uniref:type I-E CRISPR-associated protein Cse2/CasB n=1 Tax=Streptomyces sp. NPDC008125 TaxID=3364811 RepID=UPI0036EEADDE
MTTAQQQPVLPRQEPARAPAEAVPEAVRDEGGRAGPEARSRAELVGEAVHAHVAPLCRGYQDDEAAAVAALARIRRGAGKPAGSLPDLWGLLGLERLDTTGWGEADVVRAEEAVHLAVTLWALHQQSHPETAMHVPGGPDVGGAVRRLMKPDEIDEPVRKRFVRAGSAPSIEALGPRLRELVLLFRRDGIALDYAKLARQLYRWQGSGGRAEIHRAWGRGFHQYRPPAPPGAPATGTDTGDTPPTDADAVAATATADISASPTDKDSRS